MHTSERAGAVAEERAEAARAPSALGAAPLLLCLCPRSPLLAATAACMQRKCGCALADSTPYPVPPPLRPQLIFMMIFAIVAVDFFKDHGSSGTYTTVQTYGEADAQWGQGEGMEWTSELPSVENTTVIKAMTLRGFHFGQEYFGTFFRSLFTLFQVLTGESWSEAVVRPLLFGYDPGNAFLVATFFTIYILLTNVVLQNVVVAVLLDKFNEDPNDSSAAAAEGAEGGGGALATYEIPSHAAIAGQVSKRGGKQPAESSRLTKADTAVLREASRLGARVDIPPSGGGGMRSGASEGGDEVARLRGDVDRALREAAMIRSHLHVILSRLPEPPEDAAESSMAA